MLFQRRDKPNLSERVRVALWPRRSWGRSARYVGKRVLRLSATPHAIAAGFAAGAMVSYTPFVGFHFVMAGVFAYLIGGNVIASAFGTAVGNPLTFPIMWTMSYRLGRWMLGEGPADLPSFDMLQDFWEKSWDVIMPVLKPMLVGAVPLGIVNWVVFYFLVRTIVRSFQDARQRRLAVRAEQNQTRAGGPADGSADGSEGARDTASAGSERE